MKKLLLVLLLIPMLCAAQTSIEFTRLWEVNSTYKFDPDTCAFLSDTTAADSAIFYMNFGDRTAGLPPNPTLILKMDSTGVGTLVWADSVCVRAYPRVDAHDGAQEADGSSLITLWNEGIILELFDGTQCLNWSPTAERTYFIGHQTWWNEWAFKGITYVISVAGDNDAMYINRLGGYNTEY